MRRIALAGEDEAVDRAPEELIPRADDAVVDEIRTVTRTRSPEFGFTTNATMSPVVQ